MRLSTLIRLWIWISLLALIAFAFLSISDQSLKAATGFGTVDLQWARTGADANRIFLAWLEGPKAATAGFLLGFDYVFMPLYAIAFYFSAMLAREAFFPKRGVWRRAIDYLGYVPLLGAIADATENALEFAMLSSGASDVLASYAFIASAIKSTCFAIGLALFVAGFVGVLKLRRPKPEEEET
jgi:hypothetical protein